MTKNCVTTDCGHKFHCSCLMQNAVHNGFGCPFCRTAMAEEPQEDEEEDDDEDNWTDVTEEDELYNDYALRGLRFMTNNLEAEPHDILDVFEENEAQTVANQETQDEDILPTAAYIATKLAAQGVTMEQLVKALLVDHSEYEETTTFWQLDNMNGEIFGKMRIIISNYRPDEPAVAPPAPAQAAPSTPAPTPVSIPSAPLRSAAEPKVSMISPRRLSMEFNECMNEC